MVFSNKQAISYVAAPVFAPVHQILTDSFELALANYAGNPLVNVFVVSVKGGLINRTCTLQRTATPLKCPFEHLLSGSQYTVRAVACMSSFEICSKTTNLTTWTIPQGKLFCCYFEFVPFSAILLCALFYSAISYIA